MVLEGLEHEALEAKKGFWADPQPGRRGVAPDEQAVLEDAKNQVFAEFTRRYTADGTWQESFTRSPVGP